MSSVGNSLVLHMAAISCALCREMDPVWRALHPATVVAIPCKPIERVIREVCGG